MMHQSYKQGKTRDRWINIFPLILRVCVCVFWVELGIVYILGPEVCQRVTLENKQCF